MPYLSEPQSPRVSFSQFRGVPGKEIDVFAHIDMLKVPERVYICGAGPTLPADLLKIPAGAYVVACNRAIIAERSFAVWMFFDSNCPKFPWFRTDPGGQTLVISGYRLHKNLVEAGKSSKADLTWSSHRMHDKRMLIPGGLQGGATVVGCALQLMYWAGASHITLAGCPFNGDRHFDGTPARKSRGVWPQATKMRALAREIRMRRVAVDSLSNNAAGISLATE